MASDLNRSDGAEIRAVRLNASISFIAVGRVSQVVPISFQINATASSRKTSTPRFAIDSISSIIRTKTSGF